MKKGIDKNVMDAVDYALKDDQKLTDLDKKKFEPSELSLDELRKEIDSLTIRTCISLLKQTWNPERPETQESIDARNYILSSIMQMGAFTGIDQQEIVDWIYGPNKLSIESYLSDLWYDEQTNSSEFADAPFPAKKIWIRVSPKYAINAIFYDHVFPTEYGGSELIKAIQINVYKYNGNELWPTHGFKFPEPVSSFDDAHELLVNKIQELRGNESYMVDRLTRDEEGSGMGSSNAERGTYNVDPGSGSAREFEEGPEKEANLTELLEKLKNTSDSAFVLEQAKLASEGESSLNELVILAILDNTNPKLYLSNENLFKFFELNIWNKSFDSTDKKKITKKISEKFSSYNEFLKYISENITDLFGFSEGINDKYLSLFLDYFEDQEQFCKFISYLGKPPNNYSTTSFSDICS